MYMLYACRLSVSNDLKYDAIRYSMCYAQHIIIVILTKIFPIPCSPFSYFFIFLLPIILFSIFVFLVYLIIIFFYRDLHDVGAKKISVFALNKVSEPALVCGKKINNYYYFVQFCYGKISGKRNGRVKKGVIFATYSSLIGESTSGGKYRTRFSQLLHWLGPHFDGVVSIHYIIIDNYNKCIIFLNISFRLSLMSATKQKTWYRPVPVNQVKLVLQYCSFKRGYPKLE